MRLWLQRASVLLIVVGSLWWGTARWLEMLAPPLAPLPARRVWSLPAGALRALFSPDGRWLVWMDNDGLNVSSTERAEPRQLVADPGLAGQSGRAAPVLFLPDSASVLVPTQGRLKQMDLVTGRCTRDIPLADDGSRTPEGVARWLHEGFTIAYASSVEPVDLAAGPDRNQTDLMVLDLSPNGRWAAFWAYLPRPAMGIVDIETGQVLWRLPKARPGRVRFTADSRTLIQGGDFFGLGFRDVATGAVRPTPAGCADPLLESWSMSDDRTRIALLHPDARITFVRTDGKSVRPPLLLGRGVFWNCRWYAENDFLVVEGQLPDAQGDGVTGLVLRDLADRAEEMRLMVPEVVVLGVSPHADYAIVRVDPRRMRNPTPVLGNARTGQEWAIPLRVLRAAAFDRGGRFVALGTPANLNLYRLDGR